VLLKNVNGASLVPVLDLPAAQNPLAFAI
jgi:hypothetical protein